MQELIDNIARVKHKQQLLQHQKQVLQEEYYKKFQRPHKMEVENEVISPLAY